MFLLTIKNYRIQDATYSDVDTKCEIDSFSKLQIPGGKHQVVGRHTAWSREQLAEQNLVRSFLEPSSLSLFLLSETRRLRPRVVSLDLYVRMLSQGNIWNDNFRKPRILPDKLVATVTPDNLGNQK